MTEDTVDLYRAVRDALAANVSRTAIQSAIHAVLADECSEVEAAMLLRRVVANKIPAKRRRAS
jgi:hypothetical protein